MKRQTIFLTGLVVVIFGVLVSQAAIEISDTRVFSASIQTAPADLQCKPHKTPDDGKYAGVIKYIGSQCFRQVGNARPVLLDPKRDQYADLHVGEKFQCFSGALAFELKAGPGAPGLSDTIRSDDGCHTIKMPAVPGEEANASGKKKTTTSPAGPFRGDSGPFCSPIDRSGVIANQFLLRWLPDAVGSVLSFTLLDSDGHILWSLDNVKGKSGGSAIDSRTIEAVRNTLQEQRDRSGDNSLRLILEDGRGHRFKIQFSLLTEGEEQALTTELNDCVKDNQEVMLSLCRINAFSKRKMYREISLEYDAALKLAPESEALVSKSRAARLLAGESQCFSP